MTSKTFLESRWPWVAAIGLAMLFRISQYLFNRSLWLDEIKLASNLTGLSFTQLAGPLKHSVGAPIGFLWLEKAMFQGFGASEYVLRFIPLVAGLLSILLFTYWAYRAFDRWAAFISLVIFSISDKLIYYSSELKQYSTDVFWVLLIMVLTLPLLRGECKRHHIYGLGITGAIAIWFSHPIIFILAGLCFVLLVKYIQKDLNEGARRGFWGISIFWFVNFALFYTYSLADLSQNEHLKYVWDFGFWPFPPQNLQEALWLPKALMRLFHNPIGLPKMCYGLSLLFFVIGLRTLWGKSKAWVGIILLPLALVLIASVLRQYPFAGRLLLFVVPGMILILGHGASVWLLSSNKKLAAVGVFVVLLWLALPISNAMNHIIQPRVVEEIKPALKFIQEDFKTGDMVYVYYGARRLFWYYAPQFGFEETDYRIGVSSRRDNTLYYTDLDKLMGMKRVWVLFSHVYDWEDVDEKELFLNYLNQKGSVMDEFHARGADVYLYDFSWSTT